MKRTFGAGKLANWASADKWKKLEAETGEISFKKPPSSSSSPWSQRTSQRSTSSTQLSSQGSQKPKFKMPLKKLTPKKRKADPVFHHVPATNEYGASGRVTRSSGSAKEALASADFNASDTTRTAVSIAADRLGMSVQLKPPPSSTGPSSAHSSFLDTVDPASPLTSPPEYSVMNPNQKNTYCITSEDMPVFTKKQGPSVCSFCKDTVENTFLEERMRIGKRLTIRQQAQFCKDHKRRAAEDEWRERGYPTIDWASFDGRLNHYHLALDNILQKRRTSFYRNAFGDLVKSGKNWTWQQDVMSGNRIEELSPGYYGGRGAKLMYAPSRLGRRVGPEIRLADCT